MTVIKSSSSKKSGRSITNIGLDGAGSLIKLLPTGTVFLFQFLNPIFTNNGECDSAINQNLSSLLICMCGLSCFFSSFTDSYTDSDGLTQYGFATVDGLWPYTNSDTPVDLSKYRLRAGDFVHAFLSLLVFAVLAVLDTNTVQCFDSFDSNNKNFLKVSPAVVGAISGAVFTVFPNTRHGIGYPKFQ